MLRLDGQEKALYGLLGGSLAIFAATAAPLAETKDCFTPAVNARLNYRVFEYATPPVVRPKPTGKEDVTSPYLPGSDYATTVVRPHAITGVNSYYLLWTNRCFYIRGLTPTEQACRNQDRWKGNLYQGMRLGQLSTQVRAAFSTYDRANACTIAQALKIFGAPMAEVDVVAHKAGILVVPEGPTYDKIEALSESLALAGSSPRKYIVDKCVLPKSAPTRSFRGLMLDYEVFDDRTPAEVTIFFSRFREITRRFGLEFLVGSNPIPRPQNGLTSENARDVLAAIDGWMLPIATGASPGNAKIELPSRARQKSPMENIHEQLDVLTQKETKPLTPDLRKKIFWNVSLFDTSLSEGDQLQQYIKKRGFGGIMLFRNYVAQGGACSRPTNQLIACLAIGQCDGQFHY